MNTVFFIFKIVAFVLSCGYFFSTLKKNLIVSIFTGIIALISGFLTIEALYEYFHKDSIKNFFNKTEIQKEKNTEKDIISLYASGKLLANLYNLMGSYPWLENKLKETDEYKNFKKDKQYEINQEFNMLTKKEQSLVKKTLEKPSMSNIELSLKYMQYDLNEKLTNFFEMMKVFGDLNGDGIPELVFDYNNYCGSGGCTFPIYQINIKDQTVTNIGYTSDIDMESSISKDKINGWYPIIYNHRIGSTYYETLLVFENGKYLEKGTLENEINEKEDTK